jgi:hypothetical protein
MRQSRIMLLMGATALVAAAGGFEASHSPAGRPSPVAPASATETAQPSSDSVDVAPPALHNMDLHLATADVQPVVQTVRTTGVVAFNDLRMAQLSPPARGRSVTSTMSFTRPPSRIHLLINRGYSNEQRNPSATGGDRATAVDLRHKLPYQTTKSVSCVGSVVG